VVDAGVLGITTLELQTSVTSAALAARQASANGGDAVAAAVEYAGMNPTVMGPVQVDVEQAAGTLTIAGHVTARLPFGLWLRVSVHRDRVDRRIVITGIGGS
jgi:hypothetical protein